MIRKSLSLLVTIALLAGPTGAATPQHLPPPKPRPAGILCNDVHDGDQVAVRGNRLARPGLSAPSPVTMMPPPPPPPPATMVNPQGQVVLAAPASPRAVGSEQFDLGGTVTVETLISPAFRYGPPVRAEDRDRYDGKEVAAVHRAAEAPVSTFSVDVDTGSYANARRFLMDGRIPPAGAVRTEEFLNYFRYDYARPADASRPFSVTADVAQTPWNAATRLIRIGIKGYDVTRDQRPAANLVFLVDVSGSMQSRDKLPLVKTALGNLAGQLNPRDRVSIVVYAGAAGLILEPTHDKASVQAALDCLEAGGSTAGGDGIKLAYAVARKAFIAGGINRIILCTDGDFNVGVTSDAALKDLVKKERESGITLTTLGFGQGNYNEAMMEAIADVGNGNYGYVDSAMEARKLLDEELSSTLFTIAKDVKIQVEFNPAVIAEYRLIGYENRALREEDFANDKIDAGDIGAGHQVTAIYEVVPAGAKGWLAERRYASAATAGGRRDEAAWLKLRYKLPGEDQSRLIEQPIASSAIEQAARPSGDFAFAAAVAAFGQRLRGDSRLGEFRYADIRQLAGNDSDFWRQEFVKLVDLAEAKGGDSHQAMQ